MVEYRGGGVNGFLTRKFLVPLQWIICHFRSKNCAVEKVHLLTQIKVVTEDDMRLIIACSIAGELKFVSIYCIDR